MNGIKFYKMSGSGNDFILIDNRKGQMGSNHRSEFAKKVCRRRMSVGGDGLIIVEDSDTADFRWQFFNADGSEADMCGNGARCAARFAHLIGVAGSRMTFETGVGLIQAEVDREMVRIKMTNPRDIDLAEKVRIDGRMESIHRINTGVPHTVLVVDDLETVPVESIGPLIRYHRRYAPEGTNVNFIQRRHDGTIAIRTYERGVEAETLACGTGSVAGAIVASRLFGMDAPIRMIVRSGLPLEVSFTNSGNEYKNVYLKGDARVIYQGCMGKDAYDD